MDIFGVIFPIIFIAFVAFILFTNKGKGIGRKLAVGEVLEDYGIIGNEFGGKQKFRLLKCQKNQEIYYVLEVQSSGLGATRVDWIKLGNETVRNLVSILK
jgi:hypothetical protein